MNPHDVNPGDSNPLWSLDGLTNVGMALSETAQRMPDAIAVAAPRQGYGRQRPFAYDQITFSELEKRSCQIALGIQRIGVAPGTRLALMVPPGIDFVAFVFGLFKAGVVVILIDPGMGRNNMIRCLAESDPAGIVGISKAQLARVIFRKQLPKAKTNIVVSSRFFPGCYSAKKFTTLDPKHFKPVTQTREAHAAVIFTTGSTGPPKGVLYRHRVFIEQARQIRDYFQIKPGSVDVSGFPLFALFNASMGTTTVFPEMDATRPAEVEPLNILDAVERFGADQSFGSPALWNTVSTYCEAHNLSFPTIRRVLTAGAPVPAHVLERVKKIIHPQGEVFTPYGATESLPVACNSATVVLEETSKGTEEGRGTCVGNAFPDMNWKVIEITDDPITSIDQTRVVERGGIGELIVQGDVVTDQYVTRTSANAFHKISDGPKFWHRMGDVGYLDESGRFWFCGRKQHRVTTSQQTLFTIPVEGIVNTDPSVYRSALVGVGEAGKQTPVLIIEPWPETLPSSPQQRDALVETIRSRVQSHAQTKMIRHILFKEKLPVDIRHNSKIFREQLAVWAAQQLPQTQT
ncbi:MAG: fatty acid CoA ligase family protein [Mariniblastus sp.]|nr:fatty acid CoA ligase family protein [Mariniblastus sp.]